MLAEIACQDVTDRVQIGAAVMGHDALGVARGARGVAQRNRVPFIVGHFCHEARIALRQRRLIFDFADPFSASEGSVIDVDHERLRPRHQPERLADHAGKLRIDQNDPSAAMVELEGDREGVEGGC